MQRGRGSTGVGLATFPFIAAFPLYEWCPAVGLFLFVLSGALLLLTFAPWIPGIRSLPHPIGLARPRVTVERMYPAGIPADVAYLRVVFVAPMRVVGVMNLRVLRGSDIQVVTATGNPLMLGHRLPAESNYEQWAQADFVLHKGSTSICFRIKPPEARPFEVVVLYDADEIRQVRETQVVQFP